MKEEIKMFATLVGTDTQKDTYREIFERLCSIAIAHGFTLPNRNYHIQSNQTSLVGWTLEQKGPPDGNASFYLAVTAPKMPGMAPIPITKTIEGPLFAVMVMDTFYTVSRQDRSNICEYRDSAAVEKEFEGFLESFEGELER